MVNKVTKKAILKIKETVDSYAKEMAAIGEKIASIDEKYRKLAEKKSKELKAAYADLEAEQEIWNTSLSRYDTDVVNEVLGTSTTADEEPEVVSNESEGKVVDTIFEENNETVAEPEPVVEESATEETPVVEETTTVDDSDKLPFDASEETKAEEDASAEPTEEWPESEENITEPPVAAASEDEWPEFPEDWK